MKDPSSSEHSEPLSKVFLALSRNGLIRIDKSLNVNCQFELKKGESNTFFNNERPFDYDVSRVK